METKKFNLSISVGPIFTILVGIALIFWTGASIRLVARVLAALLVIVGAVPVVSYFFKKEKKLTSSVTFTVGVIVAALGVWIFLNPDSFTDLIPKLFGVFMLLSGIMNLGQTLSLVKNQYGHWVVSLIFALLTLGMGIFLFVEPAFVKDILVKVIGGFLVFDGVTDFWTGSRVNKVSKESKKELETVDAEAVVVEEDTNK